MNDDDKPKAAMVDPHWTRAGREGKTFTKAAYALRFGREPDGWHRGAKIRKPQIRSTEK